jgi:hypothetical protein
VDRLGKDRRAARARLRAGAAARDERLLELRHLVHDHLDPLGHADALRDREDEQVPTHESGPHGERVRSIQARPEPDLLDEADPSLRRVDPEALAAAEPVVERGRSGWTTLAVHRTHNSSVIQSAEE